MSWCVAGLIGYALWACLYALALSMFHKATFTILKNIQGKILDKLPKLGGLGISRVFLAPALTDLIVLFIAILMFGAEFRNLSRLNSG